MGSPVTLLASTVTPAGSVTATSAGVLVADQTNAVAFILDVTAAATDTVDTLDVKVQAKADCANWYDVVHFTQVLGDGGALRHVAKILAGGSEAMFLNAVLGAGSVRHILAEQYRVTYTQVDGDNDASFTFEVTACPM